jgi:hypothetical protein
MTLVELMLALSITALIGVCISGTIMAVADAQAATDNKNDSLQAARSSLFNLERMIRDARLVSAGSATTLSLWMGDTNGDGQINVDETIYLTYLPAERVVRAKAVKFPLNLDTFYKSLLNDQLPLSASADVGVLETLPGVASYVQEWSVAVDVDQLEFKFTATPPLSEAVTVAARFGSTGHTVGLNSTVRLRAGATKDLIDDAGEYVLAIPACEVTHG